MLTRGDGQVSARQSRQVDIDLETMTEDMMNIKMLSMSVPGIPGEDYPILNEIPETSFTCEDKDPELNYSDIEAYCQVFHSCMPMGDDLGNTKFSRLCPNGTIFDQVSIYYIK